MPKDCSEFQCIFITKDWNESHSEVIGNVVDIYDSAFGNAVVRNFFKAIDRFSWIQEKQVKGIMKRAGGDDGYIFFEQFHQQHPKLTEITQIFSTDELFQDQYLSEVLALGLLPGRRPRVGDPDLAARRLEELLVLLS